MASYFLPPAASLAMPLHRCCCASPPFRAGGPASRANACTFPRLGLAARLLLVPAPATSPSLLTLLLLLSSSLPLRLHCLYFSPRYPSLCASASTRCPTPLAPASLFLHRYLHLAPAPLSHHSCSFLLCLGLPRAASYSLSDVHLLLVPSLPARPSALLLLSFSVSLPSCLLASPSLFLSLFAHSAFPGAAPPPFGAASTRVAPRLPLFSVSASTLHALSASSDLSLSLHLLLLLLPPARCQPRPSLFYSSASLAPCFSFPHATLSANSPSPLPPAPSLTHATPSLLHTPHTHASCHPKISIPHAPFYLFNNFF